MELKGKRVIVSGSATVRAYAEAGMRDMAR